MWHGSTGKGTGCETWGPSLNPSASMMVKENWPHTCTDACAEYCENGWQVIALVDVCKKNVVFFVFYFQMYNCKGQRKYG